MVHVETVDLSPRGITFPSDRVGMVIAQPYLSLTSAEPYQCTPVAKPQQLAVITDTLRVARVARHGATKTHFTVFPEYCLPGLDGVAMVDSALRADDWPTGTIVIGGTDGLSKPDFVTLVEAPGTYLDAIHNDLNGIAATQWINCGITWVKGSNGTVERWLQPKVFPAWPEQNVPSHHMFRGNSVFSFKGLLTNGAHFRFSSIVCFDWIATVDGHKVWWWVMEDLRRQASQAQADLSLSWFFVIQCNQKPSDDTFLTEVNEFFDQTTLPNVRRERACLVLANSAGKSTPGRSALYGSTSLVFSGQTLFGKPTKCPPTFSNGSARLRSSTLLSPYYDVLFRERGACIHSFTQVNPGSLTAGPAGRRIAVENAFVFPLAGATDPRAPSDVVPACIKWLNDELDDVPSLSADYPAKPLAIVVDTTHRKIIADLRLISPQSAENTVKLAAQESKSIHPDEWTDTEADALKHLVHTLDIIGLGFSQVTVGADPAHAAVVMNNQTVDLLAIRGVSHEECIKHSRDFLPLPRRKVLLISRDPDNNPCRRRLGSFLKPESTRLGQELNITDPASGSLHLGYRKLLDIFLESTTSAAVQVAINDELVA